MKLCCSEKLGPDDVGLNYLREYVCVCVWVCCRGRFCTSAPHSWRSHLTPPPPPLAVRHQSEGCWSQKLTPPTRSLFSLISSWLPRETEIHPHPGTSFLRLSFWWNSMWFFSDSISARCGAAEEPLLSDQQPKTCLLHSRSASLPDE